MASSTSELAPKPIRAMSFAQKQLAAYKAVGLLVISEELAKSMAPGANDLFANQLRAAVAKATDAKFLRSSAKTQASSASQQRTDCRAVSCRLGHRARGDRNWRWLEALSRAADERGKTVSLLRDTGGMLVTNGMIGTIRVIAPSRQQRMASCSMRVRSQPTLIS